MQFQCVGAVTAIDNAAEGDRSIQHDRVVAVAAGNRILATARMDNVVAAQAAQRIVAARAEQGVCIVYAREVVRIGG